MSDGNTVSLNLLCIISCTLNDLMNIYKLRFFKLCFIWYTSVVIL